ncbi:MAG: VCBS repeat-containing protein [Phycisphaerae bacterium]|nr:VCBS repeat-containing protein [Phycisphaerae bacterium]
MGQTALVDIDGDGDLDWVSGEASHSQGRIFWWEYQGPNTWIRHDLGKGNTDVGGTAADLNGDGWPDVFSGSKILINTGNPRKEAFIAYEIGAIHSHDSELADINGDGRLDAIANSDKAGLFWFEIPADCTKPWKKYTIATAEQHKIHGGVSPKAVGDIDGDGDNDVVTGQAWYENLDGKGLTWR